MHVFALVVQTLIGVRYEQHNLERTVDDVSTWFCIGPSWVCSLEFLIGRYANLKADDTAIVQAMQHTCPQCGPS